MKTANRKRFVVMAVALVIVHIAATAAVFAPREALDDKSWQFLESQRPVTKETSDGFETSFVIVADGLNFALFRRPFGGWEAVGPRIFAILNLPAFLTSQLTFESLQLRNGGSSKLHSDLATAAFCCVSVAQWVILAFLLNRRWRRSNSAQQPTPTGPHFSRVR